MNKVISQDELIKEQIELLHSRGSGDWQSLSFQALNNPKRFDANIMQMFSFLAVDNPQVKILDLEVGRGGGKTTSLVYALKKFATEMPRSKTLILGSTFKSMLDVTLPSLIHGLEMIGWYRDLHFFVGKKPPKNWKWDRPYQSPEEFNRTIYFYTGAIAQLVSMEQSGEGRGFNADARLADENAILDGKKISVIDDGVRGSNFKKFKDNPCFAKKIGVSTTPLDPSGIFFTEREEVAKQNPITNKFIKGSYRVNQHNLPADYGEVARRNAVADYIYLAEYENVRPGKVANGFYFLLNKEKHTYTSYNYDYYDASGKNASCLGDSDMLADSPLIGGIDWGAAINCLDILQHDKQKNELLALKEFYALGADNKMQDDMADDFAEYYKPRKDKTIYLHYDHTGNNKTGNTRRTRARQFEARLRLMGWTVHLMTVGGRNALHSTKHLMWEEILKEDNPQLPKFRINRSNCPFTWISMTNAKAKISGKLKEIQKDKTSEKSRSKHADRRHATDFSDAIDAPVVNMFARFINTPMLSSLPEATIHLE